MSTWSTSPRRPATVHTFIVGEHHDQADCMELRIVASAGYHAGLAPADPTLHAAATFGTDPSTPPGVYLTGHHSQPTQWRHFDNIVVVPVTDGSPMLRFRAAKDHLLPAAFREAARHTLRVLLVDISTNSLENQRTVVLFSGDAGNE